MDEMIAEKVQSLYNEAQALEERLMFIDQQLRELDAFKKHISELEHTKENDILASLGKGIFVKSIIDKKQFFIDVGAGIVLQKEPVDIRATIDQQIGKLGEMRQQSLAYFLEVNNELEEVVKNARKSGNNTKTI